MQCIAHRDLNQPVLNKNKIIETRDSLETASLSSLEWIPWIPHNPMRLMLIEDNGDANDKSLPHELSQTSGDRAIRSGAGTVLSIGKIQVDNMNFHTEKHIFPCNFRSSRIFWSMTRPMKRTVYLFEILHQTDLTMEEEEELFNTSVQEEDKEDDDGDVDKNKTLPVFRAVAVDNPTHVMISRSINDLYNGILKAIKQINKDDLYAAFEERAQLDAYGLNAYQFFCLSLPFTRHAIELIPEAVSAMFALPPYPQYKPSYYLPSEDAVVRLQQKRLLSLLPNRISANGCARADSYEVVVRSRGTRVTRILSKAVDDSARSTGEDEKSNDILIDEGAESRREKEMNTFRYMELSASYLVNPFARLEVRKSAIHGFGLFTKTRFDKNDMIVEYIGQKIRQVVADRREIHYEEEGSNLIYIIMLMLILIPILGVGSCYLFRLDKDDIVDATRTGGMARFINHCCEPNAYARVISTDDISFDKHIVIFAARDIQEGEEITYDYKFPIEDTKLRCYCGASKCSGSMN